MMFAKTMSNRVSIKEIREHMKKARLVVEENAQAERTIEVENSRKRKQLSKRNEKASRLKQVVQNSGVEIELSQNKPEGSQPPSGQGADPPLSDLLMSLEVLKDFDAPADSTLGSLWDKRYRSDVLIDKHLLLAEDKRRMRVVGKKGLMRWLEAHSIRMASIAREVELELEESEDDNKNLRDKMNVEEKKYKEKIEFLEDQIRKNPNFKDRAIKAEKEIGNQRKIIDDLQKELASERARQSDVLKSWSERQSAWEKKEADLKTEIGRQLIDSFDNCLAQVKVLYPEVILGSCDPFKEVQDGRIISPTESEESASNDEVDTAAN